VRDSCNSSLRIQSFETASLRARRSLHTPFPKRRARSDAPTRYRNLFVTVLAWVGHQANPTVLTTRYAYYNDETSRTTEKDLERGNSSPLWRLSPKQRCVQRPGEESRSPLSIRRRQVACRKRGQVRALQNLRLRRKPPARENFRSWKPCWRCFSG